MAAIQPKHLGKENLVQITRCREDVLDLLKTFRQNSLSHCPKFEKFHICVPSNERILEIRIVPGDFRMLLYLLLTKSRDRVSELARASEICRLWDILRQIMAPPLPEANFNHRTEVGGIIFSRTRVSAGISTDFLPTPLEIKTR